MVPAGSLGALPVALVFTRLTVVCADRLLECVVLPVEVLPLGFKLITGADLDDAGDLRDRIMPPGRAAFRAGGLGPCSRLALSTTTTRSQCRR
jgi:hypothetical protein